eukprot:jgi/Bigna1/87720/estExt_fgenesh1_pg.C_230133
MNRCRIIATIMKEDYKSAVGMILKQENYKKTYAFELVYCYYQSIDRGSHYTSLQLKQNEKALALVNEVADRAKNKGFWHVQAQLLRRLGRIGESAGIYEKQFISKKAQMSSEFAGDIRANYLACLADSDSAKALTYVSNFDADLWSYAVAFNAAIPYIEAGNLSKAKELVEKATELCKNEIEADGGDSKEIESEMEAVNLLVAYIAQLQDDKSRAEEIYRGLLTSKDPSIAAGARMNLLKLLSIGKKTKGNEAERWARELGNYPISKLSETQKRVARLNHCLALLQGTSGKEQDYIQLKKKFPNSAFPTLAYASGLYMGKTGWVKSLKVLQEFVDSEEAKKAGEGRASCLVAIATIYFTKGKYEEGIQALSELDGEVSKKPAVVGTIVRWLSKTGNIAQAAEKLDEAIGYWKAADTPDAKQVADSLRAAGADIKAKLGDHKAAAEAYELMAKSTGEVAHLCGVVVNAALYDIDFAKKYAKKLPALDMEGLDVDALEGLGEADDMEVEGVSVDDAKGGAVVKKKKRKRKKRLPKNYDPNETPDPERWLPKWERSYNKRGKGRRRNKNNLMRGPQGGAVRADLAASLDKTKEPVKEEKKPSAAPKLSAREKRRLKKKRGKR